MAGATEGQIVKFYLSLTNLNLKSHMWLDVGQEEVKKERVNGRGGHGDSVTGEMEGQVRADEEQGLEVGSRLWGYLMGL